MGGETVTGVGIKQADPFPDQPVLGRPRLPLVVARGRPRRVVGRKVVALVQGQQGDADDRDAGAVQPLDDSRALVAQVREHERNASVERLEVGHD